MRVRPAGFKRYSERNEEHEIISEPRPISAQAVLNPLPEARDSEPVDFSECGLANPGRIWKASQLVRKAMRDSHRFLP